MHDAPLISLIALGLVLAPVGGLIAVRIGRSPIVGYPVAGSRRAAVDRAQPLRLPRGRGPARAAARDGALSP